MILQLNECICDKRKLLTESTGGCPIHGLPYKSRDITTGDYLPRTFTLEQFSEK